MERFHRTGDLRHHSSIMRTAIRSMRADMHNIEQTLVSLSEHDLTAVVELLATAGRVYVVGSHSEYGIACYFASTLCWIRDRVYLIDETHSPSFDAMSCAGEGDVIVALSFPPYPVQTVRILETAVRRGVQSVAVTDSPLSPWQSGPSTASMPGTRNYFLQIIQLPPSAFSRYFWRWWAAMTMNAPPLI